ncbi:MAG: heme lyase CcmF/NrfE family subunit [Acidimicrobiia bacterium]|nr:heme lyase CcmF/NrfE family subunit [Acidimicrobiia bacterium]
MATLGTFLILAAFVVAAGAFAAGIAGGRRRSLALTDGAVGLSHVLTGLTLVLSSIIVYAFVVGDYSIKYVNSYSDSAMPLFFKLTSYWGGLDGSLLFWVTLLAIFASVAIHVNRERHRLLIPWVVAVIAATQMFFLFLMVIHNNPFETHLFSTPADGRGLNPLLQNFYMIIHPPMLYLGFVGMTIPFAFGLAALITGQLDDSWLRAVRRWTMTSWLFLSLGLALGGLWAYEELGWGGYWGWDPVENAGLLPWFTATAFLHSVMVQERRGMLKVWNVSLVIMTFFLTIFGTFMTRSGIVQSVHAFGEDRELAWMFTVFMIVILTVSFGLVIWRMPLLRARNELDSWASREAAFLANNWILLFSAFFVLFATMFPTISEALRGERLTVGPPFFDKWMLPIGLMLLLLTGIGPLLAWRKSAMSNMLHQFLWPAILGVVTTGVVMYLGANFWAAGLCFGLCAWVFTTIVQEFWRGSGVRQRATGTDRFTAMIGLFARSRRRYAGYIVHLGIVLIFFGFAGNGFKLEEQINLEPGQEVAIGDYVVKYDALKVTNDAQKQMITGHTTVTKEGAALGGMYPARWFFNGREDEPTTEVAIRRGFADDLYIVLAGYELETQRATFEVTVNPLVNWVWFGFGILGIGTILSLLPERAMAYAAAKSPAGAVTTALLMVFALGAFAPHAHAQHVENPQVVLLVPRSPDEKKARENIICMCGTCGRKRVAECTCGTADVMRQEIAALIAEGKSYDDIVDYYVTKYGSQEVLAAPIDKGFNRLAWFLPYAIGALGILVVGGVAVRWTRRGGDTTAPAAPADTAAHQAREARLDDELRDLD